MIEDINIPLLDISSWKNVVLSESLSEEQRAVAVAWNNALSTYGFVLITGHGVPTEVSQNIINDSRLFFETKSVDEKLAHCRMFYGHREGGYTPPGLENVALSVESSGDMKSAPDPVENFVFTTSPDEYHSTTGEKSSPIPAAQTYYSFMESLLKTIHRLSSASLGLEDMEFFNNFYFNDCGSQEDAHIVKSSDRNANRDRANGNILRLARYFSNETSSLEHTQEHLQYGAHTDYQGFTILRPDPRDWSDDIPGTRGLQVQLQHSGRWIPVKLPNSSASETTTDILVVNVGDLLQRWTNDRWHSAMHRVVAPLSGSPGSILSRYAQVFFSGPFEDVLIESIPGLQETIFDDSSILEVVKYEPILSGDHLKSKLSRTNVKI